MVQLKVLSRPVQVGAGVTNQVIQDWGNPCDQSLRVSIFVGQVAGTVDIALQGSDGGNVWTDVKATTIGASTDKTVAFTPADANIASTAHGFLPGDQIAFISAGGSLPPEFIAGVIYYVQTAATNSFTVGVSSLNGTPLIIPSTTGSGAQTASILREAEITVQAVNTSDQTVTPVKPHLRVRVTTGGGESIQIVQIESSI